MIIPTPHIMTEKEFKEEHEMLKSNVRSLNYAVFGNPEISEDIGMKKKVDELHEIFISARGAAKALKWTIITLGAIAGSILAIRELISKLK